MTTHNQQLSVSLFIIWFIFDNYFARRFVNGYFGIGCQCICNESKKYKMTILRYSEANLKVIEGVSPIQNEITIEKTCKFPAGSLLIIWDFFLCIIYIYTYRTVACGLKVFWFFLNIILIMTIRSNGYLHPLPKNIKWYDIMIWEL